MANPGISIVIGGTDVTGYLRANGAASWSQTMGQRGLANIPLEIAPGVGYTPTTGMTCYLYSNNRNTLVSTRVWAGMLGGIQINWNAGNNGQHQFDLNGTTLEKMFDSVRTPKMEFNTTDAGVIFTSIFNAIEGQLPVAITLGTISTGVSISNRKYDGNSASASDFSSLATDSGFVWYIDPKDLKVYFHAIDTRSAPFTITNGMMRFGTIQFKQSDDNFRDTQVVRVNPNIVPPDVGVFDAGAGPVFTLPKSAAQVLAATLIDSTTGVHSSSTGTFSGTASAGDMVDVGGLTYTFVATLDNTVPRQVLKGATDVNDCQNLVDAINAGPGAGTRYSSPTYTNPLAMCDQPMGSPPLMFTIRAKVLGTAGSTVSLASTALHFSFADPSLGGGADHTGTDLRVGPAGAGTFDLTYSPNDSTITTAVAVPTGKTLVVTFRATGGDVITVSNGASGTLGLAPQYRIASALGVKTLDAAIQFANSALAQYSNLPSEVSFEMDAPDPSQLSVAHWLPIGVTVPLESAGLLNRSWIIKQIDGRLPEPRWENLPEPHGHWRCTLTLCNNLAISTFQDSLASLAQATDSNSPTTIQPSSPNAGGGGTYIVAKERSLLIKDTTVADDVADHVVVLTPVSGGTSPVHHIQMAGVRIVGNLRHTISADLVVRINKISQTSPPTTVSWTFTIPMGTPIDMPVEMTISGAFLDLDVLTADVLASDGSTSAGGVAAITVDYEILMALHVNGT